jgi:two-component system LytT family response regulator/two-component system response regulator LytT
MPLRALVVDDEQPARDELCFLLGEIEGVEVVGQPGNGPDALAEVERLDPDVVFLAIQMPGLGGVEVASRIARRGGPTEVVFVTAFDRHAVDAFEVNAVDYLLKPVEPARLEQAVARVRRRVTSEAPLSQRLDRIVQMMSGATAHRTHVAVRVGERLLLVRADEIIFASLVEDSITIVTGSLSGTSGCRTLDELQAQLDPRVFWRVHRSHLVNINQIKEIVPWFSRNYLLRMRDPKGSEIPVSRTQTRRLREYLKL